MIYRLFFGPSRHKCGVCGIWLKNLDKKPEGQFIAEWDLAHHGWTDFFECPSGHYALLFRRPGVRLDRLAFRLDDEEWKEGYFARDFHVIRAECLKYRERLLRPSKLYTMVGRWHGIVDLQEGGHVVEHASPHACIAYLKAYADDNDRFCDHRAGAFGLPVTTITVGELKRRTTPDRNLGY